MNKIVIVLDSKEGHITKVFTSDLNLVVKVVDLDTEAQKPVWEPYNPKVKVVVADVDAAAREHIKENVPDYEPEEEGARVRCAMRFTLENMKRPTW